MSNKIRIPSGSGMRRISVERDADDHTFWLIQSIWESADLSSAHRAGAALVQEDDTNFGIVSNVRHFSSIPAPVAVDGADETDVKDDRIFY